MLFQEPFEAFASLCPSHSLVGSSGLEPPTSRLSGVRSNHLSYEPISMLLDADITGSADLVCIVNEPFDPSLSGGDEQNRTVDPLLARQVLSQLSYTPISSRALLFCCMRYPFGPSKLNNESVSERLTLEVGHCSSAASRSP